MLSVRKAFLVGLTTCILTGCGTFVPEIQEFWGDPNDVAFKVNAISSQVECELSEAVGYLEAFDAAHPPPKLGWLQGWVAQVTLTLTILESTALNPGVTLNTPLNNGTITYGKNVITAPQSSSFGLGGTLSSAGTRTDAITAVYRISDLAKAQGRSCIPPTPNGTLFIESDLKLKQWLIQAIFPEFMGTVQYPSVSSANVKNGFISHEVSFKIVSSGNATPTWKLVRVSANSGSLPFVNVDRERTQDLLITLGPPQSGTPQKGPPALAPAALNSALAAQIGAAVATAIKASSQ
jgi:hypothetical protein